MEKLVKSVLQSLFIITVFSSLVSNTVPGHYHSSNISTNMDKIVHIATFCSAGLLVIGVMSGSNFNNIALFIL